jgi:HTH-type transcriptional regulator/antitoxin HigA
MLDSPIVLNEREARRARSTLARIDEVTSPMSIFDIVKGSLPSDVVEQHRKAVRTARAVLSRALELYERARAGDFEDLLSAWRTDPGTVLIIARIARGMSQADLAETLGVREQQIQRYEAERYRSISVQNYRRIAATLGVELEARIKNSAQTWIKFEEPVLTPSDVKKRTSP